MADVKGRRGLRFVNRIARSIRRLLGIQPKTREELWLHGEDIAASFLARAGFRIMARNARTPKGEADIVALDPTGSTLVIVEVKTRRTVHGTNRGIIDAEAAAIAKSDRLHAIARHLGRANRRRARVDVVAIEVPGSGDPVVRHYAGIGFSP
jgi:putative endonuclease